MGVKIVRKYLEGKCRCGTAYKVYVDAKPAVIRMQTPAQENTDRDFNHSVVFYCEGCRKEKSVSYAESDLVDEEIPAGELKK